MIWQSPSFRKLKIETKLFWFFLMDSIDDNGQWEIDFQLASFLCAVPITQANIDELNGDKLRISISGETLTVLKFKKTKEKKTLEKSKFEPPLMNEVLSYFKELNHPEEADKFFDYFESNGWKVGRTPMKSWKAACRTWARRNFSKPSSLKTLSNRSQEILDVLSNSRAPARLSFIP